jgi:hypothetical protein
VDEDSYFIPYEDIFEINVNKKVVAEVKQENNNISLTESSKPQVKAEVKKSLISKNKNNILESILTEFKNKDITLFNINKKISLVKEIIDKNLEGLKFSQSELNSLQENIINNVVRVQTDGIVFNKEFNFEHLPYYPKPEEKNTGTYIWYSVNSNSLNP